MTTKLDRVRADLNLGQGRHGHGVAVHLNNAGASPMPTPVLECFKGILDREQSIGAYAAADEHRALFERTRELAGRLVGAADPAVEIALVDSATTAWARAFYSVKLCPGDVILTCEAEYAANYCAMLQQSKRFGAEIRVVGSRPDDGTVDVEALRELLEGSLGRRVRVVCITHVPTNGGLVNPAAEIGRVVKGSGVGSSVPVYILDACQSVGQLPVDVQEIQCDFLSATGRKFLRGPRGTGFLYANKGVLAEVETEEAGERARLGSARITQPPTIDHFAAPWVDASSYALAPTARRFEQWESNFAGLCSLGVAIEYALELGVDEWIWPRVRGLGAGLRTRLLSVSPRVQVHDLGSDDRGTRCGIVTFSVAGVKPAAIEAYLLENGIYVSVSPSTSTLLDSQRRALPGDGLVRASVSYINTEEELDRAAACLTDLLMP